MTHDQTRPTAMRCDDRELEHLLGEGIAADDLARVQDHLDECPACANRLENMAAAAPIWVQASDFLSSDEFDCQEVTQTLAKLSTKDDSPIHAATDRVVVREIRGWLDPSDDPRMLGRFAGYEIVGVIGHGGMGIVLKGYETSLNRYVAIKVLAPRLASNATARRRFAREAQAAAAVLHENVVAIHRVDEVHDLPFLVMPYFSGESLQRRIQRSGPLTLQATLRIGAQIARGLSAAHAQGLVHRDIKPANILLEPGIERVQITDFGLARAADDAALTRTGMIAGTPEYMSPEQASGRPLDARSDLFSLGSVLHACLTGKSPFQSGDPGETIQRVCLVKKRDLRNTDSSIPLWMDNLIEGLHQCDARNRWGSASAVAEMLEACALHVQAVDKPLPAVLTRRSIKHRLVVGALPLLISFATILFFFRDAPNPDRSTRDASTATPKYASPRIEHIDRQDESVREALASFRELDIAIDEIEMELRMIESNFVTSTQD